jgi:hypothetical protein
MAKRQNPQPTPVVPAVVTPPAPPVFKAIAIVHFADALTDRSYQPGDVVPWELERARHYAERGLVFVQYEVA